MYGQYTMLSARDLLTKDLDELRGTIKEMQVRGWAGLFFDHVDFIPAHCPATLQFFILAVGEGQQCGLYSKHKQNDSNWEERSYM